MMKKLLRMVAFSALAIVASLTVSQAAYAQNRSTNELEVGGKTYKVSDLAYELYDEDGNLKGQGDLTDLINSSERSARMDIVDYHDPSTYITLNNGEKIALFPKGTDGFFILDDSDVYFNWETATNQSNVIVEFNYIDGGTETTLEREVYRNCLGGAITFYAEYMGYYKIYLQSATPHAITFDWITIEF